MERVKRELKTLYEKSNDTKKVSPGLYIVKLESLTVDKTKSTNRDCMNATFFIVEGEEKGKRLYMTQVISTAFTVSKVCNFVKSLGSSLDVEYKNLSEFSELVFCVFSEIDGKCEYDLKYYVNDRGYEEYEIKGIYDII